MSCVPSCSTCSSHNHIHSSQVWPDSQSHSPIPLLPTHLPTQTHNSGVDPLNRTEELRSPYARESADDCDRRWVEDCCGHANVLTILSTLLVITVATFFSRYHLTSRPNSHDISAFFLVRVLKFFGGSSGGATAIPALPATSFSKPLVSCSVLFTRVLWLASLTVGLGCAVLSTLFCQWIYRYALADRLPSGLRGPGEVSVIVMHHGSIQNFEAILRMLCRWLLVAVFLFLWGLDIQLLHAVNPPSPFVVIGLSVAFFVGQCLVVTALPQFPSSAVETSNVA